MTKAPEVASSGVGSEVRDARGHVLLLFLSVGSTGAAAILWSFDPTLYRFIFGDLSPVGVTLGACVVGSLSIEVLRRSGSIRVWADRGQHYLWTAMLGMALTVPVVVVDWLGGFPQELNVPAPEALLFYPSIAVVAEFLFHALPLALVSLFAWKRSERTKRWAWWAALATAASIEPVLQVVWGAGESPVWANAYVGFHLVVFNVVGLGVLMRGGFLAMYVFRLAYYAIWHIAWGHVRVGLLFGSEV